MSDDKAHEFTIGMKVRTAPKDDPDFVDTRRRRAGTGTIVDRSDAHGLCFGVLLDGDLLSAYYNPDELAPIGEEELQPVMLAPDPELPDDCDDRWYVADPYPDCDEPHEVVEAMIMSEGGENIGEGSSLGEAESICREHNSSLASALKGSLNAEQYKNISRAFYKLAVSQRDAAWRECEEKQRLIKELLTQVTELVEAGRHTRKVLDVCSREEKIQRDLLRAIWEPLRGLVDSVLQSETAGTRLMFAEQLRDILKEHAGEKDD